MPLPQGEQVSLEFYFADKEPCDAMRDIVLYCLGNGARFVGRIGASLEPNIRQRAFSLIYEAPIRALTVTEADLHRLLEDKDTRIVEVEIDSFLRTVPWKTTPEAITFNGVSSVAALADSHPVAVLAEGWVFDTPGYERAARVAGRRCTKRLMDMCNALSPDYASIIIEDTLPCRTDLGNDPIGQGNWFRECFVGSRLFDNRLNEIEELCRDCWLRRSDKGLFVFMWKYFSPTGHGIDPSKASDISARIAGILRR